MILPASLQPVKEGVLRRIRYWKLLSVRKLLYLPHAINAREKLRLSILLLIVFLSGGLLFYRLYLQITKPAPQVGNSYIEGSLKEPRAINPLFALQDTDRDLARLVFSGLLSYSGRGEPIPDLAEHYEISADGKSYTIFLRKNAFWQDGEKVGAEDVLFTIRTIQNPRYKSVLRANWQGVGIEKLDEETIRLTLKTPYAPFLENLTTGILPKHLWENIGPEEAPLHELNLKPVGSGPYAFDQFRQEKDGSISWYRLKRNSKYFREGPYLKKITFIFFKNEEEMITAWKKGLIDGFGPVSSALLKEISTSRFSIKTMRMPRIFGLFFNQKNSSFLGDAKIRQAVAHAIDRSEIVEKVIPEEAIPASAPLPFYKTDAALAYATNQERARRILEEAGWKDLNGDGLREKRLREKGKENIVPLRITLTTSDWPDLLRAAALIKSRLKEVGMDLVVEARPFPELEASVLRPRNFEMLLFGQVYGYEPDPFAFWHSSQIKDPGLNITLYANKKVDKILEDARRTSDPTILLKKYDEFSRIISADLPAVFLYSQLYLYLLPSDIQGADMEKISLPSDRFNEINKWYRGTKRVFR